MSSETGEAQLTSRAYDDDGNVTTSTGHAITVANTAGTLYQATIATSSTIPAEMRYDPDAGTQDGFPVDVVLTNNSATTWNASTVKLRYQWLAPDGSEFASSGDISIGGNLAASGSTTVSTTVDPPVLPEGVLRGRFTLRFDLYDTTGLGSYFAALGNLPLDQIVTLTRMQPNGLGLDPWHPYDTEDLGGGVTNSVNLANGNNVVSLAPFNEPGIGLDTTMTMAYNSLELGSTSQLGNNWSLGISTLSTLGLPLDIHPNLIDTALLRDDKWVGFTAPDGAYRRFTGNGDGTYYTPPAGGHLYLKKDSSADPDERWQIVAPDRTTYFYDEAGYPTKVKDADNNALTLTESDIPTGGDINLLAERVTSVTDQGGRSFTLDYYTLTESGGALLPGKLKSITDHVGHTLTFTYYYDGNLMKITEAGGTNPDGSNLPDRTLIFNYTSLLGGGPAISSGTERHDPSPLTLQSTQLYSVIDFRGNETTFTYATSGDATGRVISRTNRTGDQTTYTYGTEAGTGDPTTSVGKPLSRDWVYTFRDDGHVIEIDDPVNPVATTQTWTDDNQLEQLTEPTGAHTDYLYDANGNKLSATDQLGHETTWTYESFSVDSNDTSSSGNWEAGRGIGHISRLVSTVEPQGNATSSNPDDYKTTYDYTDSSHDHVATETDPLGNETTHTWNTSGTAVGTLASTTLPDNGDGITRTTY